MAAAGQETNVKTPSPRFYQDRSYRHGFLGAVSDLQKAEVLQDVVLEVEGRRFPCHRLVLSAASPAPISGRAMFTPDLAETPYPTTPATVHGYDLSVRYRRWSSGFALSPPRPGFDSRSGNHLLKCDPTLPPLLQYKVLSLVLKCDPTLPPLLQYMVLSLVLKCDPTLPPLLQYMVSISEEFCSLSVDQLTEIISHDELDVKEEIRVWEAQERDVVYEPQSRAVHQLWLPSRPSSCRDHDCYQDNIYILAGHSHAELSLL
ncbi:hypothetical protein Bbelb_191340 [Branchiostoma belcheri]|nr:hypothetical protein Bbelb_191340 [Branchiostoma belcheri]